MTTWKLSTTESNSVNQTQVWNFNGKQITLQQTYDSGVYAIRMFEGYTVEVPEGLIGPEDFTGELSYTMQNNYNIDISNYWGENTQNVELVSLNSLQSYNLSFSSNMSQAEIDQLRSLYMSQGADAFSSVGYTLVDNDINLVGVLQLDCFLNDTGI